MKIGFIGLGKLGMPCAVAMALKGHDVMGHDLNPDFMTKKPRIYKETGPDGISGFDDYLAKSTLCFGSREEVAEHSEIIFVAVQTPHEPKYEGVTRLTEDRQDFNYDFLVAAIRRLAQVIKRDTVVVIISTVLPGTIREKILPELNPHMKLCYNPFFIAMGTTMRDFLNPEFVLFGVHDPDAAAKAEKFYSTIASVPFYRTTIENAELIKVSYNTFIGMKIVFANLLMEICHKTPGTDVDSVTQALGMAQKRLISDKYLSGGMGDGGGCHPRDNIAMSWLARKLDLSWNWFDSLMMAREKQTDWLADLMCSYALPKVILGYSFKPESNIVVGSPALLLKNILEERGERVSLHDPYVDRTQSASDITRLPASCFLVGTRHAVFQTYSFPANSVVIDPWRFIDRNQPGIKVVSVGRA